MSAAFNCLIIYNFKSVRLASNPTHKRYRCSWLSPGTLTAHGRSSLVLLHSWPDTVHWFPLRETQTSTLLTAGCSTNQDPRLKHHPCCSGLQVQGTAISPAARKLYNIFQHMVSPCLFIIPRKRTRCQAKPSLLSSDVSNCHFPSGFVYQSVSYTHLTLPTRWSV